MQRRLYLALCLAASLGLLSACSVTPESLPHATGPAPNVAAPPAASATPEPVAPASSAGAMFRNDLEHLGVYDAPAMRALPELKWQFQAGSAIYSSPAVVGGAVFFGSQGGFFYAVDSADGRQLWQYEAGAAIQSSPAVADGLVYFQSHDGYVHAVDIHTGQAQWRFDTGVGRPLDYDLIDSSPAVANGLVYIGGGNGAVHALEAQTGREVWRHAAMQGAPIRSSPAVSHGVVYIGAGVTLQALAAENGEPLWSFSTLGVIRSSPTVSNGVVYVGDGAARIYAVSAASGEKLWTFRTDRGWVTSSAAVSGGVVYIGGDDLHLNALEAQTGQVKWRFRAVGENIWSSPAVAGGVAYVGDWNYRGAVDENGEYVRGYVYGLDLETGQALWKFPTGGRIIGSPALSGGLLFIGSEDGYMYALEAQS